MTTGAWVLLLAVAAVATVGIWRSRTDGRFRPGREAAPSQAASVSDATDAPDAPVGEAPVGEPSLLAETAYADALGERATLLQFSSAFCTPCRATRRTLGEVADVVPGVVHVEVDAESQLELVRRLGILRTPTTIVLDAGGREVTRAVGAPTKDQVLAALASVESPPGLT